jgi:hypothetical protein
MTHPGYTRPYTTFTTHDRTHQKPRLYFSLISSASALGRVKMISKSTTAQPGPFTTEEVQQYLDLIKLPKKFHPENNPPVDLEFLTALHVHTISTIPYENLDLHYSAKKEISLDPQHCFEKFVRRRSGRGGYCMEVNQKPPFTFSWNKY